MTRRPAPVVRDGRHSFEVAILILTTLVGGVGLLGPGFRSNAIAEAWGPVPGSVWYVMLLALGLFALGAVHTHPLRRALQLERIAMIGLTFAYAAYVPAVMASNGKLGFTAGAMFLGLSYASGARVWRIGGYLVLLDKLRDNGVNDPQTRGMPRGDV